MMSETVISATVSIEATGIDSPAAAAKIAGILGSALGATLSANAAAIAQGAEARR